MLVEDVVRFCFTPHSHRRVERAINTNRHIRTLITRTM